MTAALDELAEHLEHALSRAAEEDRLLRHELRSVADAAALDGPVWESIQARYGDRGRACRAAGEAAVAWMRAGGGLTLEDPDTAGPDSAREASHPGDPELKGAEAEEQPAEDNAPVEQTVADESDDEPTDEVPAAAPLTADRLALLQERMRERSSFSSASRVVVQTSLPREIVERLGAPRRVATAAMWAHDADLIHQEAHGRLGWERASNDARLELTRYLVARARYLQDEASSVGPSAHGRDRLTRAFAALRSYQADTRRGYVNGLGLHQRPAAGTWWAESEVWWRKVAGRAGLAATPGRADLLTAVASALGPNPHPATVFDRIEVAISGGIASDDAELLALVEPHAALFEGTGRLKTLRSVLKDRARPADAAPASPEPQPPSASMSDAVVSWTRGKHALLVGSDRSNDAVDDTLDGLELAGLRRESGKQMRRVESMVAQVRSGSVDLVIFIRGFLSHKASEALVRACRSRSDVDVVWVDDGYGAASIARALEGAVARLDTSAAG